jgi:hypothetical protein
MAACELNFPIMLLKFLEAETNPKLLYGGFDGTAKPHDS